MPGQLPRLLLCAALLSPLAGRAVTNNLALTPPMGWNDWNSYGCGISESAVTNNAAIIALSGLQAAGYQYVDIDDGWASSRDSNGVIQAYSISGKFPHGIPWVAGYVHSLGLKLGVYTDDGTNTCSSCITGATPPKDPGSFNYEYVDAFTYAAMGADYLKDDNCNATGEDGQLVYTRMSDGLMRSGRPILFCLCGGENGNAKQYQSWSPAVGNYWRSTSDIKPTFLSMISHIDANSTSAFVAGPGRWNDPDMLEIGNGEFATNFVEAQTHFTMWCEMAAPLIMGNNLGSMSLGTLQILTNTEAIAVDQDPAGEQGVLVGGIKDNAEVWSKPLGYDFTTRAVALLNRSTNSSAIITCNFTNLAFQPNSTATVRDLWTHTDLGTFTNSFTATNPAWGSMLLKIVGSPIAAPAAGTNYLSDRQPIYAYTGFGTLVPNKSIGGNTITLDGVAYPKGIGTHARSGIEYDLGGVCTRFQAKVGIDDESSSNGSVNFEVFADGALIYTSGVMTGSTTAKSVDLDMTGVRRLTLGVDDADDGNSNDHSDWANAIVIATNAPQVPHAPTGLLASQGNAITLNWNSGLAALTYNVKRATTSGGPYTTITNVPIATFADSSVGAGTNYYYVVSAISSFGESSNSGEASAASCNVPLPPTNVVAVASNSLVTVRWNASAGASSYNVYRMTGSTPPTLVGSALATTNFTDSPVGTAVTNYYLITAANACNVSGWSAFDGAVTPPAAPTLTATPGNAQVNLNWTAGPSSAAFNVKRSTTNGGPYTTIASSVVGTGYLDTTAVNGTTYFYVVSALDVGGESFNSSQASATAFTPVTAYWTNTITSSPQNWNVNANWTNWATFPNSSNLLAVINAHIPGPQTINLNQALMVGSLTIGDIGGTARYTIQANGGSLTFNASNAVTLTQIPVSQGDTIAAPITITTNLIVINNSINPLTLAGNLTSSGGNVTIGSGTLQVGDGNTNGSLGSVNVTNNTALVFNRSDSVTMSGVISGSGSVAQIGTGILTLSGANSFNGGLTIQNGTLQAGNKSALGPTSGVVVITNSGSLDVNALVLTGAVITVSGAGNGNGSGAIFNTGGQQTLCLRSVTLLGDTTIGGTNLWNPNNNVNRWDIRAASNSSTNGCYLSTGNHPYKLTKTGGNQISMVAVCVDTNLGDIDIQQGLMGWETATTTMGNPASNLIVRAGATLSFFNASTAWNKHFVLYGDGVHTNMYNWSGANVVIGPMQLNGDCVFWGGGTSLGLYNVVSGTGNLIENGTYHLILAGTNNYSGNTTVNGGNLTLTNNGSISTSAKITVNSGATLDASQRVDATLNLASGQSLSGNGTLNGNVSIGSGATLAAGNSIGTLTFNNDLMLSNGSTTVVEINKSVSPSNDLAQVTGNVIYGGTLLITNLATNSYTAGDSFKLFNAANYSGVFTNIVPAIPAVNLAWNTNTLTNGILSVVSKPTAPPHISGMNLNGNNFVFSGIGGVPNWTYYLLASTNLGQPTTNWTVVSTNAFDAGGNFNFTNPNAANLPPTFYLLKLR
jgi:alpha-galactosidase